MNLVSVFTKTTGVLRHPIYLSSPPSKLKILQAINFNEAAANFAKIKVFPGWSVYFWNRKLKYIDHIAIVPQQRQENLNLYRAKLIHGTPPPIGKAYGPFASPIDYSGIRIASVMDYLSLNPNIYSRIIVGFPSSATKSQIVKASKIAKEAGGSGLLLNKPALYSFQILNKFLFVGWFDYKNHNSVKLLIPYFIARKRLGSMWKHRFTYCGDLVGQIYHTAGIKNLPKAKILFFSGYRSSTFYEWARKNNTLTQAIIWKEKQPLKF